MFPAVLNLKMNDWGSSLNVYMILTDLNILFVIGIKQVSNKITEMRLVFFLTKDSYQALLLLMRQYFLHLSVGASVFLALECRCLSISCT